MVQVPIVKINDPDCPGDYLWINESLFDSEKHTLFGTPPLLVKEEESPPDVAEPGDFPTKENDGPDS